MALYLDDATLAGDQTTVHWYCSALQDELEKVGLRVNVCKSEVIPAAGADTEIQRSRFDAPEAVRGILQDIIFIPSGTVLLTGGIPPEV